MPATSVKAEIKTVGRSGQISLGKSYAGRLLRLERRADGEIVLTPVAVVPESQLWTSKSHIARPSPRAWNGRLGLRRRRRISTP